MTKQQEGEGKDEEVKRMEKYDVLSVVGEGSYGLVMRCRHRESGQFVAIKKFLETEDDPTVRKMAIREIRMLKVNILPSLIDTLALRPSEGCKVK